MKYEGTHRSSVRDKQENVFHVKYSKRNISFSAFQPKLERPLLVPELGSPDAEQM